MTYLHDLVCSTKAAFQVVQQEQYVAEKQFSFSFKPFAILLRFNQNLKLNTSAASIQSTGRRLLRGAES